jgi:hypothetical protein
MGRCSFLPLWPLVFFKDEDSGEPPSCGIRYVPFLFTLVVWRSQQPLDDLDGGGRTSRCFYFGVLAGLLLGVTREGGRIRIDAACSLVHFQFSWRAAAAGCSDYWEDVEQRRYLLLRRRAQRGASPPLLRSINSSSIESDENDDFENDDVERCCAPERTGDPELDRVMWAIDFHLLPLIRGHWSRKRAFVASLAPLPFFFAFKYLNSLRVRVVRARACRVCRVLIVRLTRVVCVCVSSHTDETWD